MDVQVTSRTMEGRTVVAVSGEVDVYTAPTVRERVTSLLDTGHTDLVVDLTAVRFLDSTGLGLLIGVHKKVRGAAGRLQLVIDSAHLVQVFQITALDRVFTIRPTLVEALAADRED